jgi:hypothetical protein
MPEGKHNNNGDHSGHYIGGMILVGLGTLFLLINFNIIPSWGESWPAILIIIGLGLIIGGLTRKKKSEE